MKITVIQVGRVRQAFIKEGEQEYLKRLRPTPYAVSIVELGREAPESLSPAEVQEREAIDLLKRLERYDCVIALDERGKHYTSSELAQFLDRQTTSGTRAIAFLIGGAHGFSEKIRQRADSVLSLSKLTLPHQFARLVLVEQIYRAYTIAKGISYHK